MTIFTIVHLFYTDVREFDVLPFVNTFADLELAKAAVIADHNECLADIELPADDIVWEWVETPDGLTGRATDNCEKFVMSEYLITRTELKEISHVSGK
jgi:hypothetical protein